MVGLRLSFKNSERGLDRKIRQSSHLWHIIASDTPVFHFSFPFAVLTDPATTPQNDFARPFVPPPDEPPQPMMSHALPARIPYEFGSMTLGRKNSNHSLQYSSSSGYSSQNTTPACSEDTIASHGECCCFLSERCLCSIRTFPSESEFFRAFRQNSSSSRYGSHSSQNTTSGTRRLGNESNRAVFEKRHSGNVVRNHVTFTMSS